MSMQVINNVQKYNFTFLFKNFKEQLINYFIILCKLFFIFLLKLFKRLIKKIQKFVFSALSSKL